MDYRVFSWSFTQAGILPRDYDRTVIAGRLRRSRFWFKAWTFFLFRLSDFLITRKFVTRMKIKLKVLQLPEELKSGVEFNARLWDYRNPKWVRDKLRSLPGLFCINSADAGEIFTQRFEPLARKKQNPKHQKSKRKQNPEINMHINKCAKLQPLLDLIHLSTLVTLCIWVAWKTWKARPEVVARCLHTPKLFVFNGEMIVRTKTKNLVHV